MFDRPYRGLTTVLICAALVLLTGCPIVDQDQEADFETTYDFAYQAQNSGQNIHMGTLDGHDLRVPGINELGNSNFSAQFSPDGKFLSLGHGQNGVYDAYLIDLDDGSHTRLTEQGEEFECPMRVTSWNPDSDTLTYNCPTGDDDGPVIGGVATIDGELTPFDSGDDDISHRGGIFMPDGDLLMFSEEVGEEDDESKRQVRRVAPDELPATGEVLVEDAELLTISSAAFSPDGSQLALSKAKPDDDDDRAIVTLDLENGEISEVMAHDGDFHYVRDWHPEDDRILVGTGGFGLEKGKLHIVDASDEDYQTVLRDTDEMVYGSLHGEFSPDGERVIFGDVDTEGGRWYEGSIYLIDVDGENLEKIGSTPNRAAEPTFNSAAF